MANRQIVVPKAEPPGPDEHYETGEVELSAPMWRYLDVLVEIGLHGDTREAVMLHLIRAKLVDLIATGFLDRAIDRKRR